MKVKDLFERQRVIEGDIDVPREATELSYKGAIVKGDFICFDTQIISLEGAPVWVGGNFDCSHTKILYLHGAPQHVGGNFRCPGTKIKSLERAPQYIGGLLDCYGTKITSLHNIHKQIKHIGEEFHLNSKITSHVLGVMLIKGLKKIVFPIHSQNQTQVENIINRHLAGDRNAHDCQEELLEAGLVEYAKL